MKAEEFLEKARQLIPDDPQSRLTPLAKSSLADPNSVIDIHTHIFDRRCLSIGYILLRMLRVLAAEAFILESIESEIEFLAKTEEEVYHEIEVKASDSEEEWTRLEEELEKVADIFDKYESSGLNLKDALQVVKKRNMQEILEFYHDSFSITNLSGFENKKMVLGVLQMDLETGWEFDPRLPFRKQIAELKEISTKYPILPYMAVDPRRADKSGPDENLYQLFLEAFTDPHRPFFGVKCYPAMGYRPSDDRLDPIFQICVEKAIPVLSHCGGTPVSTFEKEIEVVLNGERKVQLLDGAKRKERARELNEPEHWIPVLKKHKKLKLNLGHLGGASNWEDFGTNGTNKRLETIFSMIQNPDWRVYGDFSFNVIERNVFKTFRSKLDSDPLFASRALYGTDYWVVLPSGKLLKEQEEFLRVIGPHQNPMLKDNMMAYLFE